MTSESSSSSSDGRSAARSEPASVQVRRLEPTDAVEYRRIMLQAYAEEPEAFTSTVTERGSLPLEWWIGRISDPGGPAQVVLGAFDGPRLVGVAGLRFGNRERIRHKATLYGVYVQPELRGRGAARELLAAALEQAEARPGTRLVRLTVMESNVAARRLYESCGFHAFGTEPLAIRVGERFEPLVHMWRAVDPGGD